MPWRSETRLVLGALPYGRITQKCGFTAQTCGRRVRQAAGFGHWEDSCV